MADASKEQLYEIAAAIESRPVMGHWKHMRADKDAAAIRYDAAEIERLRAENATLINDNDTGCSVNTNLNREVTRLRAALDASEERSKACDQIADGDYGWENLSPLCVATMSVCRLRSNYEQALAMLVRLTEACEHYRNDMMPGAVWDEEVDRAFAFLRGGV